MDFGYIVIEACGLGSIGLMVWFFVEFLRSTKNEE